MKFNDINLHGINIKWGTKLSDISLFIPQDIRLAPYVGGLPNIRFVVDDFFGQKTTICTITAPSLNRPITNINIELKAFESIETVSNDIIINDLCKYFGKISSETHHENYGSGSVIRNCSWNFDNCKIGLSFYGGIRVENDLNSFAGIYINWFDLDLIYESYLKEYESEEALINSHLLNNHEFHIMKFNREQFPVFSQDNYLSQYNYTDRDKLRRCLRVLNNENLIETPVKIKNIINDKELCIFKDSITEKWYASNRLDTILIYPNTNLIITWYNILPAKGGGNTTLNIGSLWILDDCNSTIARNTINLIESIRNEKIACIEDYDC